MGYMKIENLYRRHDIFMAFALEKIHGTSCHIRLYDDKLNFFSGGCKQEEFESLFNKEELLDNFRKLHQSEVVVYGEGFGGKMQGMSKTYGPKLRFMAFDVKIGNSWLDVPAAEGIVVGLGLEFVPYNKGPLTLEWLNEQRDLPSRVAVVPNAIAEGIVVRPIHELKMNNGERWIIKHKRDEFRETSKPRVVSAEKPQVLENAQEIAEEWVTLMRLEHVLDKNPLTDSSDFGKIIMTMQEDVRVEAEGEIVWSKEVARAISKKTATLLKSYLSNRSIE